MTITLEQAQADLTTLVRGLTPGQEVTITDGDRQVAKLVAQPVEAPPRKLGTMAGTVLYMAPDFDEPLDDFREYM